MSLTFRVRGAAGLPVSATLEGVASEDLRIVRGPQPDPAAPWPTWTTFVARARVTTRPVEVSVDGEDLVVRLLTNGACPATSALGVGLIAAAAEASGGQVLDEEGQTFDATAFRAHYDEVWCARHAAFGLSALQRASSVHPQRWIAMPTHDGDRVVSRQTVAAWGDDVEVAFAALRRRAWVGEEAPEAPLGSATLDEVTLPVRDVTLGRRCWIDARGALVRCADVGLVPRPEVVGALGGRATVLDDGCVVLPDLDASEAARVAGELAGWVVTTGATARLFRRPGERPAGEPLDDMVSVDPRSFAMTPEAVDGSRAQADAALRRALEGAAGRIARLERFDEESVAAIDPGSRRALALAPLFAALLVGAVDGLDARVRRSLAVTLAEFSGDADGPGLLWRASFPGEDDSWSREVGTPDTWAPRFVHSTQVAVLTLAPDPRRAWTEAVRRAARRSAEASGGGLFAGLFGRSRVSDAERDALARLDEALGRVEAQP